MKVIMMDIKIILLLMLATSVLMFGCAGKGKAPAAETAEITTPDDQPEGPAEEEPATPAEETEEPEASEPEEPSADASDDEALADLFQIDTDKPISDEGLDVDTPSSD